MGKRKKGKGAKERSKLFWNGKEGRNEEKKVSGFLVFWHCLFLAKSLEAEFVWLFLPVLRTVLQKGAVLLEISHVKMYK